MNKIYDKLKDTDILVIASPVYFYGISAELKTIIDRLHTPMRNKFKIKKLALILVKSERCDAFSTPEQKKFSLILFHLILKILNQNLLFY